MQSFNVAVIGDPQTGKTSLISSLIKGQSTTVTKLQIRTSQGQKQMIIWDCSNQALEDRKIAYQNVNLVVILFDLTSQSTCDHVQIWLDEVRVTTNKPVLICGNKLDLVKEPSVHIQLPKQEVSHKISVKSNQNLDRLLTDIVRRLSGQSQLTLVKTETRAVLSQRLCTSGLTQYGTFEYSESDSSI